MEVVELETMTVLAMSKSEEEVDTYDASQWFDNGGSEDW